MNCFRPPATFLKSKKRKRNGSSDGSDVEIKITPPPSPENDEDGIQVGFCWTKYSAKALLCMYYWNCSRFITTSANCLWSPLAQLGYNVRCPGSNPIGEIAFFWDKICSTVTDESVLKLLHKFEDKIISIISSFYWGFFLLKKNFGQKKYMCVYCHMSKKSRVGRSALINYYFF